MTDYNADTCCNYDACPCPTVGMPALQTGSGWRTPEDGDPGGVCCICDWEAQKTLSEPHKLTCYQVSVPILDPITAEEIAVECYQENCCGVECDPEAGGQAGEWVEIIDENGCLTGRNWIAADPACAKPESPDWISEICSCGCLKAREAHPCGEDSPLVFQEATCECKCEKSNDECESGEVVDEETCECVPCETQPEDCVELEEYNGEKCTCECAENPCEATPATPDFVAPCSCECIEIECDAGFYFVSNEEYCGCEPCGLECEGDKQPNEDCTECTGCPKKTDMVVTYTDPNDGQEKTHCCPEGTEVCFDDSIFGPAPGTGAPTCVEPCPEGMERGAGPDSPCVCKCPNEGTVICNGVCRPECPGEIDYRHPEWGCVCACGISESGELGQSCGTPAECIFCPKDKELNTSTCECECGPGLETVNCGTVNECREPCPEGETRQSFAMGTNCGCHKCGDYDPDSCGNNSTFNVYSCECECDKGYESCDGRCYEECRYPFILQEAEPPFGGCSCECQNDGFLGGVNKVYCENSNGGQATCVNPCPSHLTLNQANCDCECESDDQEECCIPGAFEDTCSCVDKCVHPQVRTDACTCVTCPIEGTVECNGDCLMPCPDGFSFDENCDCQEDYGSGSWLKSLIP